MKLLSALAAVLLLAGCDSGYQPDFQRAPGILSAESGVNTISVPDEVRAGQTVAVTVVTIGGGCERKGDTEVSVEARTVEIRPFDETERAAEACTLLLKRFPHTALVTFPEVGQAVVRAVGRDSAGDEAVVERVVTVVPRD